MSDTQTVEVLIPVEARLAESLRDPELRARAARAVQEVVREALRERLIAAMHAVADQAKERGLTEKMLEDELAAHKAERRARRYQTAR